MKMGDVFILENINLHIHCGELTALVGPNGAGKTTLFRAILGEIPHSGSVEFCHSSSQTVKGKLTIGYVPQRIDFDASCPLSVLDLIAISISKRPICFGYSSSLIKLSTEILSLTHAEHLIKKQLGKLSGGELQRVLLALALYPVPNLLLLDEPISGADVTGTKAFYKMVSDFRHRFDLSIILVSHDIASMMLLADRLIVLNRSIIADGPPAKVLENTSVEQTLGLTFLQREQSL